MGVDIILSAFGVDGSEPFKGSQVQPKCQPAEQIGQKHESPGGLPGFALGRPCRPSVMGRIGYFTNRRTVNAAPSASRPIIATSGSSLPVFGRVSTPA